MHTVSSASRSLGVTVLDSIEGVDIGLEKAGSSSQHDEVLRKHEVDALHDGFNDCENAMIFLNRSRGKHSRHMVLWITIRGNHLHFFGSICLLHNLVYHMMILSVRNFQIICCKFPSCACKEIWCTCFLKRLHL